MPWIESVVPLISCVLILGVPGILIGLALRLRGLWLAAATPLLGASAVCVAAVAAPVVGVRWSIWPVIGVAMVGAIVAWLITLIPICRPARPVSTRAWVPVVAVSLASVILGGRVLYAVHSPELFAQSFDNVFHLNAVRFILDGGNASPFAVARMTSPSGSYPYPSGWHALNALIVQISAASIPVASNVTLIAVACIVWPLGAVVLTRTLFGTAPAVLISAGVLAGGFGAYPLLPIAHIGAYPLVYSIALVPAAVAAVLEICGLTRMKLGNGSAAVLAIAMMPGVLGAHPSAGIAVATLSAPIAVVACVRAWRNPDLKSRRRLFLLTLVAYLLGVLAAIVIVRPPEDTGSPATGTMGQAIGEALTASMAGQPLAPVIAILSLVGAAAVFGHRSATSFAAFGLWLTWLVVYVIAAGGEEFARLLFTGPWYTDATRIAAFAPVVVLPLAAWGSAEAWRLSRALLVERRWLTGRRAKAATAVAAVALLAVTTQGAAVRASAESTLNAFLPTDSVFSALVSVNDDERELIHRAESIIPEGDLVAGNPWSGSSFAYALIGRRVLYPHFLMEDNAAVDVFMRGFANAAPGDAACASARKLGVRWVFDFPSDSGSPLTAPKYPGLNGLDRSDNVELVERVGQASLYRVIGCGVGAG